MLADVGNGGKTLDRAERVRAVWYMLLAALEDVETQRRGICFIALLQRGKFATVGRWGMGDVEWMWQEKFSSGKYSGG